LSFWCCFFNNLVVVHRSTHFRRLFHPCRIILWQDPSDYRVFAFFDSFTWARTARDRGQFSLLFVLFFEDVFIADELFLRNIKISLLCKKKIEKNKNRLKGRGIHNQVKPLKIFLSFFFFCSFFRREIKWNL
jgi:hypothetical protein